MSNEHQDNSGHVDSEHVDARYVIICVGPSEQELNALRESISRYVGQKVEVETCSDGKQAIALLKPYAPSDVRVPIVFVDQNLADMTGCELLLAIQEIPTFRATRKVLLAESINTENLTQTLNKGALHRCLIKPWKPDDLNDCIRSLMTSFIVHHSPEHLERFKSIIDADQFPRAFTMAKQERWALDLQVQTLKRSFLANTSMTDQEVENAMGAGFDDALDTPPRKTYPAGSILLRQNEPVDTISILVTGQVQLSRKSNGREVILHEQSAGRIIGLLALPHGLKAFYTWQAKTEVTVIPLSLEQLEKALQTNPWLSSYLVTTLIRTMMVRSKDTAELLLQVDNLNNELRSERDNLEDALKRLEESQAQLIESQKMATLGQLSAGVAHELNNPVAAMQRAADFLSQNLVPLLSAHPDGETLKKTMVSAIDSEPMSTRRQRELRAAMTKAIGDEALAQQLVKSGITTPEEYQAVFGKLAGPQRDTHLANVEQYYAMGSSLRNIASCSKRVTAIVNSLRSYTRSDQALVANVNLNEGLDDTLLMFGHALQDVKVTKHYGDLPTIECRVGEINQVWTNIIANALQAMKNKGKLKIETDAPDAEHVRVQITDSGPGVPPNYLKRVFELNFTTKQGQSGFGLGMGLTICRQIVSRHGGSIDMTSQPGRTTMTVILPIWHRKLLDED